MWPCPARGGAAAEADRCRADLPGRSAGAAGFDSEHRRIRFAHGRLGHLFPYLPNQPGYHKRLRAAAPMPSSPMRLTLLWSPSRASQTMTAALPVPSRLRLMARGRLQRSNSRMPGTSGSR